MAIEMDKAYDPSKVEDSIYQAWLDSGAFRAARDPAKQPYTVVMPPPNITGQLHMGHALDLTVQDVLIRFKRMQGFAALWLPGADHAAIATETKIARLLAEEGMNKEALGRDAFLTRCWAWKDQYGGRIREQVKKLGCSCDWERERFTLDDGCSRAVRTVFARLYERGLIYRGERLINWCPHCRTSLSDAEVVYDERDGKLWYIRYPLAHGTGFLSVATTRPETMLGDTAVAVHPQDERYKHLIGKAVILPLMGREIPIIADEYVEMEFGTGAVKITPAHDPNDFEVGRRHSLAMPTVLDESGAVSIECPYKGMDRLEARAAVVRDLEAAGLLSKIEDIRHNVGTHDRCGDAVEPRLSLQWFVKMQPLAEPAVDTVKRGDTRFVPERFTHVYLNWMENIRDWCISRQLWWGHRIPAWYCADCGKINVCVDEVTECQHCGGHTLAQDEDVLDTWFSSALWPFSTLGWPEETEDLAYFYPTNVLVTAYDIIFFWVARMIFSGLAYTGLPPFRDVLIHGIVRAGDGRKMSKSLDNGVDPLDEIGRFGTDALRFALLSGSAPGSDIRYTSEKTEAARNFANKLWNAARFALMNLPEGENISHLPGVLTAEDKWILTKYQRLISEVTANLEKYELGLAAGKLYDFTWDVYCDWYIELCKPRLAQGGEAAGNVRAVLIHVLRGTLSLLHPFMPFITEEIWGLLPGAGGMLISAPWPAADDALLFEADEREFERVMNVIRAIRARRAEMNVPPSKKTRIFLLTPFEAAFRAAVPFLLRLCGGSEVVLGKAAPAGSVSIATADAAVALPLSELVDIPAERARLGKERDAAEKNLRSVQSKLNNEAFTSKAPAAVVQNQRDAAAALRDQIVRLDEQLAALGEKPC